MPTQQIRITMQEGVAEAVLAAPAGAMPKAGVILYMDAYGLRPAMEAIAERIAAEGVAVLVPDTLYRGGRFGPFDARTGLKEEATAKIIRAAMAATTQAMTQADTASFIEALTAHGVTGPIATTGYCMGGARALNAAAAHSGRIVAAASFHGGNLANDAPDSPQRNAARIKARVYVGSAGIDGSFPPEQSAKLAEALRVAEVDHAIENYVGMAHGWCVPDHSVYDREGAERHYARLKTLFAETLGN
ncbi:dienelactone hydrolase family protein [Mesorhizobium marinum]|uniref:Dienelactone hydrolase family protein n=1 Tax=Mesorhizobium marinum TaxID=3228790 RepID=A0ABV3QW20_9HYPH